MKLLLLLMAVYSLTFAHSSINIDSDRSSIMDFQVAYFINNTAQLEFKDRDTMKFIEGKNRDSLGAGIKDVWIKIKLHNATNTNQILFLHQDLAYMFLSSEYFEVSENDELLNQTIVTPFGPNAEADLIGADAVYELRLKPQESKTIYVHQKTPAYHFYNFYIFSEKESIEYLIYEKIDAAFFVGLLLTLALYNFLIFLSSRYKEYLYYTLYLVSSTIWILYIYGSLAHYLHLYGEPAFRFNLAIMFNPIFLALFVQSIFNTKEKYKKEHQFLNSIIVVLLMDFTYGFIDTPHAVQLLSITLNYAMLVFLGVAISIYRKGNKIITIFLFAHSFYLIFNIYALLFYMGIIDSTYISSHGMGIGIAIEALFLSYLVSYKFKVIEQEKEQEKLSKLHAIQEQKISQQNNAQLQSLLSERELLLREVFHRVKNNFHMIIGILWLQGNNSKDNTPFNELINKIKSMSKINDYLYRSKNLTKIQIQDYLQDIIKLSSSLTHGTNLKLKVNIEHQELSFESAMNLGLILNELVTNSIKHNKDQEQIFISISLKKQDNKYFFVLHDNGKEFNPESEKKGVGLMLIRDFSSKLSNSVHTFSFENGTFFKLEFEDVESSKSVVHRS